MHKLDKAIISVSELLQQPALNIPAYQRPYKWTQQHLHALLDDIKLHSDKSAYRLGTVVFHSQIDQNNNGNEQLDIVDGQQRTLTLVLLVQAILVARFDGLVRQDVKGALDRLREPLNVFLGRQRFGSEISEYNLHQNFMAAKRAVARPDFTESVIDFLLKRCQVVTFVLQDVSEAFQFFDSQNARGRDLEPHDLLKAFHLREFSQAENNLKAQSVSHWESLASADLAQLFATYLFRIRRWAQGQRAQYFSKAQVDVFKGVNLEQTGLYPYVEPLRIAHHFVDQYNQDYQRKIDHQRMCFPFHLDQMVINGRRFFEMTSHYQQKIASIVNDERTGQQRLATHLLGVALDKSASEILHTLNTYAARTRTGDQYIRTLFDCGLIFYLDKFGTHQVSQAIEKLFVWAYSCRLQMQVVQLATMDNHALENNVFERIKQAVKPSDVLSWPLSTVKSTDVKGTRVDEIKTLFLRLGYYE
ncbi:DUF262 domain-containing protein [Shewanella baltica]|uniref:DUF262 domain-containing protein n=1 Tax=Shewanella baltica TaxID=62322 RepID=UPI000D3C8807|nr:DUF262 domain-containing protein [Shewanella baltica]